jgi:hypothetical protein
MNEGTEQWKDILGFSDYRISDRGRVKSFKHCLSSPLPPDGRILVGSQDLDGYRTVSLIDDNGDQQYRRIAHLVAEAFIGPRPANMQVCHENGIKTDNRASNLSYKSCKDNIADKKRHGTQPYGEQQQGSKLTEEQAREIYASCERYYVLMRRYNVSDAVIRSIKMGKTWKHVTVEIGAPGMPPERDVHEAFVWGGKNGMAVLNDDLAREIYQSDEPRLVVAARLGVSPSTVDGVRRRRTWARATNGCRPGNWPRRTVRKLEGMKL